MSDIPSETIAPSAVAPVILYAVMDVLLLFFSAVSALIIENSTRNVNQIEKKIGILWIFYTNLPGMTVCRRV